MCIQVASGQQRIQSVLKERLALGTIKVYKSKAVKHAIGNDEEIGALCGDAVVWAVSPEARYLNGKYIWVNVSIASQNTLAIAYSCSCVVGCRPAESHVERY
jgi:hypothetical protein